MNRQHYQCIVHVVLFSGLGLFSHVLLTNWGGLSPSTERVFSSVWSHLFVVATFNLLGFTLVKLSEWMNRASLNVARERNRLLLLCLLVAVLLFALNYGIIVVAKILAQAQLPFLFPNGGWRILLLVWLIELVVMSLLLANRSMLQSFHLQQMAQRLQEENDRASYAALQSQLNPHFLFNNLNTLVAEIEYNPANAVRFTRELSDVYRYVLQSQQQRVVALDEELRFLSSYIFLHQVRLGNCISIDNRLLATTSEAYLAPLSLQLLAENVIKHNVINTESPMVIALQVNADESMLEVSNLLFPKLSEHTYGVGLKNLNDRYRLLCGKNIVVERTQDRFVVKIPLLYE